MNNVHLRRFLVGLVPVVFFSFIVGTFLICPAAGTALVILIFAYLIGATILGPYYGR